jgi:hypothetical protein
MSLNMHNTSLKTTRDYRINYSYCQTWSFLSLAYISYKKVGIVITVWQVPAYCF